MKQLAMKMVSWQEKNGYLQKEDVCLYQFAYQILISQMVNITIAVFIAIATDSMVTVTVFLLSFIPLRVYAGGYHARTNARCVISSTGTLLFVIAAERLVANNIKNWHMGLIMLISGIIIIKLAPMEDANKRLSEREVLIYRRNTRVIFLAEFMLSLIGVVLQYDDMVLIITLGFLIEAFLLVFGGICERRTKMYTEF